MTGFLVTPFRYAMVRFLIATLFGLLAALVQAATLVEDQDFTGASGTTFGDWALQGDADFFSTTQADSSTGTVVRLTSTSPLSQSGTLIYDQAFSSSLGVQIVFDYYMAGGTGADGIAFFLVDGTETNVTPGKAGGTLGYGTSYSATPSVSGVPNAYFAVGFDMFGNGRQEFGNAAGDGQNLGGQLPNNFVLVGSGNGTSGYRYLGGATNANLGGGWRKADILIRRGDGSNGCADGGICVTVKFSTDNGVNWTTMHNAVQIDTLNGQVAIPDTFKIGFSGSTGGSTNNHYIDNVQIYLDANGYQVSVAPTGSGSGTVTSTSVPSQSTQFNCGAVCDVAYPVSTQVTLMAAADTGSTFTGWGGDCSGTATSTTITVNAAKSCTASFSAVYTVSTSAGANGSISPGAATVTSGGTASFSVTPDSGYEIDSISGCGGTLSGTTYTTGTISSNCTITVSFAISTYTVSASAGANGSISPASAVVAHGSTTSFTVTPDDGYKVASVSGCGGTLSGNTYTTGPITGDCTVSASFSAMGDAVIESGGGGALDWIFLSLLVSVWLYRNPGRIRRLTAVILLAVASGPGLADEGRFYAGAQLGRAFTDTDASQVTAALQERGISASVDISDAVRNAWRLFGGYRFNRYLAVEGGYTDLGKIVTRLQGTGSVSVDEVDDVMPHGGRGVEIVAVGRHDFSARYRGLARLGLWRWKSEYELRDVDGTLSKSAVLGTDVVAGLGLEVQVSRYWSARLGGDHYRVGSDPSNVFYMALIFSP